MESPPFPRHGKGRGPKAPAPAGYSLVTRTLVGPVVPAALAVSESTLASEQRDPLRVAVSGMAIIWFAAVDVAVAEATTTVPSTRFTVTAPAAVGAKHTLASTRM